MMTVPTHEFWKGVFKEEQEPTCVFIVKELEPGIYQTGLNFQYRIDSFTDFKAIDAYGRLGQDGLPKKYDPNGSMSDFFENTIDPYGIADNIEQIKAHYKEQIASNASIVIAVTEIKKENQPEEDGWRWEKWGEYIGTKNPQSTYIHDEPEIDSVFVYHVYSVKHKAELKLDEKVSRKLKR